MNTVKSLCPQFQDVTLFGDRVSTDRIKVKMRWLGGAWSNRTGVLVHGGKPPREHEGRKWDATSISQEMPKITRKPPESKGEAWNRAHRRSQPCQHPRLRLPASRNGRQKISVA